eukprot:1259054-Amphidinium_carterae.1
MSSGTVHAKVLQAGDGSFCAFSTSCLQAGILVQGDNQQLTLDTRPDGRLLQYTYTHALKMCHGPQLLRHTKGTCETPKLMTPPPPKPSKPQKNIN